MLCASFVGRVARGAPLLLRGRSRSVELLSCSAHLPQSSSSSGVTSKTDMMYVQDYPELEIQPLTVSEYHRIIRAGCLDNHRVELLKGVLVKKFYQSVEHISTAAPITLVKSMSEPEPDIVIASGTEDDYFWVRNPSPSDILLVIEVSKSTIVNDRTIKHDNYASEGIREYWIVDIQKRNVIVHRCPRGNSYDSKEIFSSGFVAPVAFPDVRIRVKDLFGSE